MTDSRMIKIKDLKTLIGNSMPFKSKAQRKKCYAMKSPTWNCDEWEKETPKNKKLPEKVNKKGA